MKNYETGDFRDQIQELKRSTVHLHTQVLYAHSLLRDKFKVKVPSVLYKDLAQIDRDLQGYLANANIKLQKTKMFLISNEDIRKRLVAHYQQLDCDKESHLLKTEQAIEEICKEVITN